MAAASRGRLKESNQMQLLSIFFGLSWLSIDTSVSNLEKTPHFQNFLEFDLSRKCEKSVANL